MTNIEPRAEFISKQIQVRLITFCLRSVFEIKENLYSNSFLDNTGGTSDKRIPGRAICIRRLHYYTRNCRRLRQRLVVSWM